MYAIARVFRSNRVYTDYRKLNHIQKIYLHFSLPKLRKGFKLNLILAFGSKSFLAVIK